MSSLNASSRYSSNSSSRSSSGSNPEFLAIRFISKLRDKVHQRWLQDLSLEYDNLRSSLDDNEILTDKTWTASPRPPLIKRQSGECKKVVYTSIVSNSPM
jgi:hypothetical protein